MEKKSKFWLFFFKDIIYNCQLAPKCTCSAEKQGICLLAVERYNGAGLQTFLYCAGFWFNRDLSLASVYLPWFIRLCPQLKSGGNNEIFAEELRETQFEGTLESMFVSTGWFPEWIFLSNPRSLFLFVALQIWGRKRLKTWVHSPTRYKVKSNRFHDSKNDLPVCIHAVQAGSKPVFVSTWIRIMEWLWQY